MTFKPLTAAELCRQIKLINGRPMTYRERRVLARFLVKASIDDEVGESGSFRSRRSDDASK